VQYACAFRNKAVESCPVGALALYLFVRFDVKMEPWPPFDDRLQWYKTKLLGKIDKPFTEVAYSTHLEVCNNAFQNAGCRYLSGTHVGRHEGCKLADMQDVPDAQMRRLGRWDHSRMVQHYSLGLPRTGARHLAGHGGIEGTWNR
jgi:Centromere DNA-binding protein complex CBF3 subunit, domain 2